MISKIRRALILLLMFGFLPVPAWGALTLLTDDEMDGIYAQGVVINLDIHLGFPEGTLSLPPFDLSHPIGRGTSPGSTAFPGSGINHVGNPLPGGTGLTINAATAAISLTVNVVMANNSNIGGNIIQNSSSFPTNLFFAVASFSP
jgi:hypothetical protein